MEYTFSSKAKRFTMILVVSGLLLFGLGLALDSNYQYADEHSGLGQRLWADLLGNGFFFFGISFGALFFLGLQYVTESAYSIVYKRILEAIITWLPFGVVVLLIVLVAGFAHAHHLYHWMDPSAYVEGGENFDHIIAHKGPYFTTWFFMLRFIGFMAAFIYVAWQFRKRSLQEDAEGGTRIHFKNITMAAAFLVTFGYGSSVLAWDLIMSLDVHWFSTLFGWYVFSGIWISGIIMTICLLIYLQSQGLMQWVKKGHIHDLGKWMFALSFLWTYLWFAQFMLIWYADIPEEVAPYVARIKDYNFEFFTMMLINFSLPMLFLMDADAKKKKGLLLVVGIIIFISHWVDLQLLIIPSSMKEAGKIGFVEFGMFLTFLGLFLFVVLKALAGRPLLVKNHPYLEESKNLYH
ncbi:MAG: quinol:cytochrome C oxidoreductase [Flavobacteriales bacterium]